tara:strand:+ start:1121 stop:1510 length:390 start_codon:yes stop_codon:yes gene_type:complete
MSPGILEIAKGKDDDEDLDYLEIEIYKDWNFWKGLGIPMFCVLMGFFWLAIVNSNNTGYLEDVGDFFGVGIFLLCSIFCLWPLLGVSLVFDGKRNEKKNMEMGAWISLILNFIVVILLMLWFYSAFTIF